MADPIWTDFGARIPMRDGARLAADIYRPLDSRNGTRVPAILV